jgi:hypothetical protein
MLEFLCLRRRGEREVHVFGREERAHDERPLKLVLEAPRGALLPSPPPHPHPPVASRRPMALPWFKGGPND